MAGIGQAAAPGADVALLVAADPIPVDLDFAIPLGLIVSELVSLAVQEDGMNAILVAFHRDVAGHTALLTVTADGAALPVSIGPGSRIIAGLLRQLGGRMELASKDSRSLSIGVPIPEVT